MSFGGFFVNVAFATALEIENVSFSCNYGGLVYIHRRDSSHAQAPPGVSPSRESHPNHEERHALPA